MPGSLTSGDIDAVRLVGPSDPATKRGLSGVAARPPIGRFARDRRRRAIDLLRARLETVVGLRDARCAERVRFGDVSAGREIGVVDVAHDVGPASAPRMSLLPLRSPR